MVPRCEPRTLRILAVRPNQLSYEISATSSTRRAYLPYVRDKILFENPNHEVPHPCMKDQGMCLYIACLSLSLALLALSLSLSLSLAFCFIYVFLFLYVFRTCNFLCRETHTHKHTHTHTHTHPHTHTHTRTHTHTQTHTHPHTRTCTRARARTRACTRNPEARISKKNNPGKPRSYPPLD